MKVERGIDFICIGAAKAGTTWLFEVLREHPQVFVPAEKELHYFNPWHGEFAKRRNPRHVNTRDWYHRHFSDRPQGVIAGEFSTSYLKYAEAAKAIYDYDPAIKLISILRHPVERAASHHRFLYAQGMDIPERLIDACRQWPSLLNHGLYFEQLAPYRRLFAPERMLVLCYDDIGRRPQELVNRVCEFLRLSPIVPQNLRTIVNPTLQVRSAWKHALFRRVRRSIEHRRPLRFLASGVGLMHVLVRLNRANLEPVTRQHEIRPEWRAELGAFFRDDLRKLQSAYPGLFDHWDS